MNLDFLTNFLLNLPQFAGFVIAGAALTLLDTIATRLRRIALAAEEQNRLTATIILNQHTEDLLKEVERKLTELEAKGGIPRSDVSA